MAKSVNSAILDVALQLIKDNVTTMYVCSGQPTTIAQASGTMLLATASGLTSGSFTGPTSGDVSGRKLTVAEQADVPILDTGAATYVALCAGAALYFVTTCTSQVLTTGNTVTVPAWDIEFADPT